MSPGVRLPADVAGWVRALVRMVCRTRHGRGLRVRAGKRRLDGAGPDRGGAHVGQSDPGPGDAAIAAFHGRGNTADRPRLRDAVELLVVEAPPVPQLGYPDLDEQLV